MRLLELTFREVNVVLLHRGVVVPTISLDRVRAARPTASVQVTAGPAALTVVYPDERMAVQLDTQRITATDNSGRPPEMTAIIEAALAQHEAVGSPAGIAFGYNLRVDFRAEGIDRPGEQLMQGVVRDEQAILDTLRCDQMQLGLKLVYRRGVKTWMFQIEPLPANPDRIAVHANIHEDLKPPAPGQPGDPPAPAWLEGGMESASGFPGLESLKADLTLQVRSALDTAAGLLTLPHERS